jgi:hypothetical protein
MSLYHVESIYIKSIFIINLNQSINLINLYHTKSNYMIYKTLRCGNFLQYGKNNYEFSTRLRYKKNRNDISWF